MYPIGWVALGFGAAYVCWRVGYDLLMLWSSYPPRYTYEKSIDSQTGEEVERVVDWSDKWS